AAIRVPRHGSGQWRRLAHRSLEPDHSNGETRRRGLVVFSRVFPALHAGGAAADRARRRRRGRQPRRRAGVAGSRIRARLGWRRCVPAPLEPILLIVAAALGGGGVETGWSSAKKVAPRKHSPSRVARSILLVIAHFIGRRE